MVKISSYRESRWPYLLSEGYEKKSEATPNRDYNCIAFAAGDESQWWWPDAQMTAYWPIAWREVSLNCFIAAFATRQYETCANGSAEEGFEKIAIYMLNGEPTHAAKQLPDGRWKSKLGTWEDIEHNTLKAVEEYSYGKAVQFMKRKIPNVI